MATDPELAPGEIVAGSDFKVVRVLGSGGMGTVYEVEDVSVGRRFVLKTLHMKLIDRPEILGRFQREARVLAQLTHPNIVEVITFKWTADARRRCYYVMEKLDGRSLRQLLREHGPLDARTATGMAIDLFDAIDHAHDNDVIHRDIKPENLFIHRNRDGGWIAKLLDFGVMKLLQADSDTAGRFLGTLKYAAPEQFEGWGAVKASDLYAAGLVIYEMIAGVSPFDDTTNDSELTLAQARRVPPLLSEVAPTPVPPALDALVAELIEKKADNRPQTALEVANRLREIQRTLLAEDSSDTLLGSNPPVARSARPRRARPLNFKQLPRRLARRAPELTFALLVAVGAFISFTMLRRSRTSSDAVLVASPPPVVSALPLAPSASSKPLDAGAPARNKAPR